MDIREYEYNAIFEYLSTPESPERDCSELILQYCENTIWYYELFSYAIDRRAEYTDKKDKNINAEIIKSIIKINSYPDAASKYYMNSFDYDRYLNKLLSISICAEHNDDLVIDAIKLICSILHEKNPVHVNSGCYLISFDAVKKSNIINTSGLMCLIEFAKGYDISPLLYMKLLTILFLVGLSKDYKGKQDINIAFYQLIKKAYDAGKGKRNKLSRDIFYRLLLTIIGSHKEIKEDLYKILLALFSMYIDVGAGYLEDCYFDTIHKAPEEFKKHLIALMYKKGYTLLPGNIFFNPIPDFILNFIETLEYDGSRQYILESVEIRNVNEIVFLLHAFHKFEPRSIVEEIVSYINRILESRSEYTAEQRAAVTVESLSEHITKLVDDYLESRQRRTKLLQVLTSLGKGAEDKKTTTKSSEYNPDSLLKMLSLADKDGDIFYNAQPLVEGGRGYIPGGPFKPTGGETIPTVGAGCGAGGRPSPGFSDSVH